MKFPWSELVFLPLKFQVVELSELHSKCKSFLSIQCRWTVVISILHLEISSEKVFLENHSCVFDLNLKRTHFYSLLNGITPQLTSALSYDTSRLSCSYNCGLFSASFLPSSWSIIIYTSNLLIYTMNVFCLFSFVSCYSVFPRFSLRFSAYGAIIQHFDF